MKDRRIGMFIIPADVVDSYPEAIRQVMGRCIVTRCEMLWNSTALEYMAISPDFDEFKPSDKSIWYDLVFDKDGSQVFFVGFKKNESFCPLTSSIRPKGI